MTLTTDEVARRAGVTEERVNELVEAGVLAEPFRQGDPLRVRLVDELEAVRDPAGAGRGGDVRRRFAVALVPRPASRAPSPRSGRTPAELCAELGRRVRACSSGSTSGFGLVAPAAGRAGARGGRGRSISGLRDPALGSGLGEGEVLRAARVWGEGARVVAQHQIHPSTS